MLIKFDATTFFWIVSTLQLYSGEADEGPRSDPYKSTDASGNKDLEWLKNIGRACKPMELPFTLKHIVRGVARLEEARPCTKGEVQGMLDELRNRISDELGLKVFFQLPDKQTKYYTEKTLFGQEVATKLSQVVGDIEEAGKCLALERTTATVFHLMRIVEVGVQEFGNKLGVVLVTEKVWQNILDEINREIKKLPESTPTEKEKKSLYAQAAAHLFNVKIAWRNPVMHPKASYTEEEAEDIFSNVKIFMAYLVTKII